MKAPTNTTCNTSQGLMNGTVKKLHVFSGNARNKSHGNSEESAKCITGYFEHTTTVMEKSTHCWCIPAGWTTMITSFPENFIGQRTKLVCSPNQFPVTAFHIHTKVIVAVAYRK